MNIDPGKINAAAAALDMVEDGMTLGLGSGSTAAHFVRLLGGRVQQGLRVRAVPSSKVTEQLARECGVPLVEPERVESLDLTVDGADEVDSAFRLIKGGGGALLREKIIAAASRHFVVIVDDSKIVDRLGAFPLPVEVTPFGYGLTAGRLYAALRAGGCQGTTVTQRESAPGTPFITDGGNYIFDCACHSIPDPDMLADTLKRITGVVEHGLFIGMARTVIVGKAKSAEVRER